MNAEFIQNLRYKLQRRVRRVHSSRPLLYDSNLAQFWTFLLGNELFAVNRTCMAEGEETGFPAIRTHSGVTDSAKR